MGRGLEMTFKDQHGQQHELSGSQWGSGIQGKGTGKEGCGLHVWNGATVMFPALQRSLEIGVGRE